MRGRYPKFEVCFARSMNAMKKDMRTATEGQPQMKGFANVVDKMKLKKLKAWEKELGAKAHEDVEHHW
jgi:hypothetical protein